jgi:hypothetical protein
MGTGAPPDVKRPGCEADSSLPSSVEVKIGRVMSPLHYKFSWHGAKLIKHLSME